jgi:anti-anti-sigma factor
MAETLLHPALHLVRLPGEFGPILRCYGELTLPTSETLRRELLHLEPLGHPVLILDLSGCRRLDVEGILTILDGVKRFRARGQRLILVAGRGDVARMLRVMGLDWIVSVFPTEEVALLALRGGGPPIPAPETWAVARALTLGRWRGIRDALDAAPTEQILHELTSMTSLCDRSEELYREHPAPWEARCQYCPLFEALGGHPEDVGCRSILDPMMALLQSEDRESVRAQIDTLIGLIETMPLPEDAVPDTADAVG